MAPLMNDEKSVHEGVSVDHESTIGKPRLLIIGAGSRGNAYARAVVDSGLGTVAAIAEPIVFKRRFLGSKYIWPNSEPKEGQEFEDWHQYVAYEQNRREEERRGSNVPPGIDGVFICIRDEHHVHAITAIAPLGLHIMSEKPLATTLEDCLKIERALRAAPERIFAIGHVLRYSPHNMLLRQLLLEERVTGDILSIEHTEPVGWWHFAHSYVRGSWRKESTTAPSLLTKSCHDIDFILWMLCSPPPGSNRKPHLPSRLSSVGSLKQFRRSQKPKAAGDATNCLSCPIQKTCHLSAPLIYNDRHLALGKAAWPVHIVNPEVESLLVTSGPQAAEEALLKTLAEDYDTSNTPVRDIEDRPWYGRCAWESDNDVCDDQFVTFEWDDDEEEGGKGSKTATFHMIAQTLSQCERRGRIYGTEGEVSYDSRSITVHSFTGDSTKTYRPEVPKNSHHGGGDDGLTQQFVKAIIASSKGKGEEGGMSVEEAQWEFMGCTIEEVIRSHAAVFAAEEARRTRKVVEWGEWWGRNVDAARVGGE